MLEGVIVKGIGGFYYVNTGDKVYECRARGLFREENIKPIVGDHVTIRINEDGTGYVEKVFERRTKLLRPPVANVDQVLIAMSIKSPDINLWLLDRFLVMAEYEGLDITIVLTKTDLVTRDKVDEIGDIYRSAGYDVIEIDNTRQAGVEAVIAKLDGKITAFAGPSGVGKSTLLNSINPDLKLETGDISQKTSRGKHTTRHVELMEILKDSYVLDTPGFSSLDLDFIEDEQDLALYFRGFLESGESCKYRGCIHDKEPNCLVKEKVEKGLVKKERYENYLRILEELRNNRRY